MTTYGALFAGYGGLEMGAQQVIPGDLAWYSEIDPGACKILAHRFPGVPNLGDITKVDWSRVPRVDVLTGGSPCQDLSHAGKRQGMTEGTRSNLWVAMREAIAQLRPSLVIWENVRGAGSAEADSDLVNHPRLLAGVRRRPGQPVLRALGRVVGDLSDLGYVGQVRGLRAADIGAPHGRFRYFLVARNADVSAWRGQEQPDLGAAPGPAAEPREPIGALTLLPSPRTSDTNGAGAHGEGGLDLRTAVAMLPTPRATDGTKGGPNQRGSSGDLMLPSAVALLPTPAVNDMGEGKTVDAWDEWTDRMKAKHGNGNGHGPSLSIEAQRLLPTPNAADAWVPDEASENTMRRGDPNGTLRTTSGSLPKDIVLHHDRWGQYAAAIHRWETLTRPAPAPTETGPKGNPRLSAAFSEWMMGLPAGWVTDVPGITRNEALRALGNGVVPRQAAEAIRQCLAWAETAA